MLKVIGLSQQGYIIDVSKSDVASITGFSSTYADGFKDPKVGDELNVGQCWDSMKKTQEILEFRDQMVTRLEKQIAQLQSIKFPKFAKPEPSK